ncbi:IS21 family transposase [Paenibacillus sp. FSL P4-0338]|uniref:IS21 family transposase n=1 Tax=unclassified Paenibacillus TaxID=185978 RepID=UPI0003E1D953|nr:IS21 family transposase [Paenibacillus sp. FSL R7-269]ETT36327.1 integrase catalytic subunit [Paenibacillus sp. FSL R7-269]
MRKEEYLAIQEMKQKGMRVSQIAQLLGRDRKTISRWLESKPPEDHPSFSMPKLAPYKDYIYQRMNDGCLNSVTLLREIRHLGYQGESTLLREYMRPLRSQFNAGSNDTRTYREVLPGEEARVDWGEMTVKLQGIKTKLHVFVMTLEYSRMVYAEFIENQKLETLLSCQLRAMEYFGGITRQVIYENLRSISSGLDSQGRVIWDRRVIQFAEHYHFTIEFLGSGFKHGHGERGIRFLKHNFRLYDFNFMDLSEVNEKVQGWMNYIANQIQVNATAKNAMECLALEELQPINREFFKLTDYYSRKVSGHCLISYETNHYSVPSDFAGQEVYILEHNGAIHVFHGKQEIAVHQKAVGKHQIFRKEQHRKKTY